MILQLILQNSQKETDKVIQNILNFKKVKYNFTTVSTSSVNIKKQIKTKKGKWTTEECKKLRHLLEQGATPDSIASILNRSIQAVYKKIREKLL